MARQVRLVVDESDHILPDEEVEKAGLGKDNPIVVTGGDGAPSGDQGRVPNA